LGPAAAGRVTVDPDATTAVRLVDLVPGQRVQATVVELGTGGDVTIGLLGGRVAAFTKLSLEVGKAYAFTVTKLEPRIVLSAARPVVLPDAATAARGGQLGPGATEVARIVRAAVDSFAPVSAEQPASRGGDTRIAPRHAFELLASGKISADALHAFHRSLGHDQEARVLRLGSHPVQRVAVERAELLRTIKADALTFLERASDSQGDDQRLRAARALVDGLSRVEVENARRTEHGTATWLPLPASPEHGVRDARMFVKWRDETAGGPQGVERPFTIVLLLDMTRLGHLRVDVALSGRSASIAFEVEDLGASLVIREALEELREGLETSSIEVERLSVRQAAARNLTIADLLAPPVPGDVRPTVDVHA